MSHVRTVMHPVSGTFELRRQRHSGDATPVRSSETGPQAAELDAVGATSYNPSNSRPGREGREEEFASGRSG